MSDGERQKVELSIDKLQWASHKDLHFSPEGKHSPNFLETFPLLLKFYDFSAGLNLTPSYHDYLEVVYTYHGEGVFHIADKAYAMRKGDILVIGNTEFHNIETFPDKSLKLIVLYFLPELIHRPGCNLIDFEYLMPFFDHSVEFMHKIAYKASICDPIFNLLALIKKEITEKRKFYQLSVKNYLCEILLFVVRYYEGFSTDVQEYNKKRQQIQRLSKVFVYLRNNYQDKITLKQTAEIACMSPSHFCKFFKKVTRHSLTDYVQRLRIDKAKEFLLNSDLPITSIAFEVGFENHSYFDRIFKRLNGMSPQELRQRFVNPPV